MGFVCKLYGKSPSPHLNTCKLCAITNAYLCILLYYNSWYGNNLVELYTVMQIMAAARNIIKKGLQTAAKWWSRHSKLPFLHREVKKNHQKLWEPTLSELWKIVKVGKRVNAESRQRQLESGKKALWPLNLPLPHLLPGLLAALKMAAPVPCVGPGSWV